MVPAALNRDATYKDTDPGIPRTVADILWEPRERVVFVLWSGSDERSKVGLLVVFGEDHRGGVTEILRLGGR